ncbi:hypothetical protein HRbin36_02027 [bacterium HR36]|nr:hypothetical protein HRbin36_02027 [bacterium HR36]
MNDAGASGGPNQFIVISTDSEYMLYVQRLAKLDNLCVSKFTECLVLSRDAICSALLN